MRSMRTRVTVPIAIILALVAAPALTACSGNLVEGIIKQTTGEDVEIPGASVPDDFPSEVPLIDGEVTFGIGVGEAEAKTYNVTIKVSGPEAMDEIVSEFEAAGFTAEVNGAIAEGASAAFTSDTWGAGVIISNDGNDGWLANYTVTPIA